MRTPSQGSGGTVGPWAMRTPSQGSGGTVGPWAMRTPSQGSGGTVGPWATRTPSQGSGGTVGPWAMRTPSQGSGGTVGPCATNGTSGDNRAERPAFGPAPLNMFHVKAEVRIERTAINEKISLDFLRTWTGLLCKLTTRPPVPKTGQAQTA